MMLQDPTILNDPTKLTPYILYYKASFHIFWFTNSTWNFELKRVLSLSLTVGNPYKDMQDVDSDEKDIDMISLFIISSMIQRDCSIDTNNGLTVLLPHLLMDGAGKDDMLKIMILMQIMGSGNNGEKS